MDKRVPEDLGSFRSLKKHAAIVTAYSELVDSNSDENRGGGIDRVVVARVETDMGVAWK